MFKYLFAALLFLSSWNICLAAENTTMSKTLIQDSGKLSLGDESKFSDSSEDDCEDGDGGECDECEEEPESC